ncbi:hypothetical protein NPIL_29361, partial [Nephila pilipes]
MSSSVNLGRRETGRGLSEGVALAREKRASMNSVAAASE